jgi:hypothetical protein
MKRIAILLAVLMSLFALVGCGNSSDTDAGAKSENPASEEENVAAPKEPEPTPAELLEATELEWNGSKMHIILVTDDPEQVKVSANHKVEGRLVKVCFAFDSNPSQPNGFNGQTLLDDLVANPIKLAAKDGSTISWDGSISDFIMKGDFGSEGFGMEDDQPRFSMFFDVPTDKDIEDYALSINGTDVPLVAMESADYKQD